MSTLQLIVWVINPFDVFIVERLISQEAILADIIYRIYPKSINPAIKPKPHRRLHLFTYCRIVPVKVGLLFCKAMEIILASLLVKCPCRNWRCLVMFMKLWHFAATSTIKLRQREDTRPIIRRMSLTFIVFDAIMPYIPVGFIVVSRRT